MAHKDTEYRLKCFERDALKKIEARIQKVVDLKLRKAVLDAVKNQHIEGSASQVK